MQRILDQGRRRIIQIVDTVLPPRCPVTGDIVEAQGTISAKAWTGIEFVSSPYCMRCGVPLYTGHQEEECLKCLDYPPEFDSARTALRYNDVSRDLILGFKHGDKTHIVSSFVPWLTRAGGVLFERADYLIPVPLHPWRLLSRRYNQAAIMSAALSKACGVEDLPSALRRTRSTASQGHLGMQARAKNVRKAFDVAPAYIKRLSGKSVILIDDVYTSGATVNECARVLKENGVSHVYVLTLARVIKED
ncbi:MAG: ComF family protein [Alphaproteobacteria bacterium]